MAVRTEARMQPRPDGFEREVGPGGLEVRTLPVAVGRVEARAASDTSGPVISGYGSVSEQPTRLGVYFQWDEEVAKGAWTKTIKEGDIRSMFNHDTNWLLGRTKAGTLDLSEDDVGLFYETQVNVDDPNAMSVHAKVARGDVDGSSVWFRVIQEEWTEPTDDNGLEVPKRRILEGELYETGPVVFPAFETTTSEASSRRSLAILDRVLRSAGVEKAGRRARLAAELLANPTDLEAEIRSLFAQVPELREAVCTCTRSTPPGSGDASRAADEAPGPGGPSANNGHPPLDIILARAKGLSALTGLPLSTKE